MSSAPKMPAAPPPAPAPAKAAQSLDAGDSSRMDLLRQKQSFLTSVLAGEDQTKTTSGKTFLG